MAEIIRMPKMSDTMEEGVIAVWHKKVGEEITEGELVAEIETDKATMDYESFNKGTLLYLGAEVGEAIAVDGILAIIGDPGEDYSALLNGDGAAASNGAEAAAEETPASAPAAAEAVDTSGIKAEVVLMPKMSDTMEEGTIATWHKNVGDKVSSGDLLAEIETDKATMDYESYNEGTLLYIGPKEGEAVQVDGVLAIIGEAGADFETLLKAHASGGAAPAPAASEKKEESATPSSAEAKPQPTPVSSASSAPSSNGTADGRIKASPLAKKLAEDKGYDLSQIQGSGENGRIVKRDVESFDPAQAAPAKTVATGSSAPAPVSLPQIVGEESFEEVKVSQMRKAIARRLSDSKFSAPHFYVTMEINMDKAIEARKSMNEVAPVKISFNDMVIKAVAAAIRQHPNVNVSWQGDSIRKNQHIHIGVAVAVDEGLLVPVIRFADNKTLSHISAEVKDLAGKAQAKKLQPSDWEGNTFTISNLGMFGVEEFTAIINPPDVCIMAVGGIKQVPVVKDGQMVVGNVMKVTLSSDHRAVDGATAAQFLKTFKGLLEDPVRILI
ncbi:MAG: pyruvate dehydrogenase complex dihydrolipoamide acetyltransferase [Bacteroidota bacterium]